MNAEERRREIVALMTSEDKPISGGTLAEKLSVSRQIIVQDIAVLKAAGYDILSTHKGYVMQETPLHERVFKVRHTNEQTEDELNLFVDLGGSVIDVFVWHKIYGKIEARLNIFSRHHVKQYLETIQSGKSLELMNVTSGYHYHTVRAESEDALDRIESALREKDYIVPEI